MKLLLISMTCILSFFGASLNAQDDNWQPVTGAQTLQNFIGGKTFEWQVGTSTWRGKYIIDGTGTLGSGEGDFNRRWEVIGDDQICFYGEPKNQCYTLEKNTKDTSLYRVTDVELNEKMEVRVSDPDNTLIITEVAEAEDPDHVYVRPLVVGNKWASIGIGGIISTDAIGLMQDDESIGQVGDLTQYEGGGISAARIALYGHLGKSFAIGYYMDMGYNGFSEGFDIENNDEFTIYNLEIMFPKTWFGNFTIGKMKAPAGLSRNWGGAYMPTAVRAASINALTKSRDEGVKLTNTAFDKRMTWGVGLFNEFLTLKQSFNRTNTYVTGRLTGLVFDNKEINHLLQLGLGTRWTNSAENFVRFKASPGVPFIPEFINTDVMPGDGVIWLNGELAWRKRNFMINAEHVWTKVNSPTVGNPSFNGSYVWFEWTLSGESRVWNYEKALPGRPQPSRDFPKGGKGLWALVLSLNNTDLNDGDITGGKMQEINIGVNWYPQKSFRWGLFYTYAWLDKGGMNGNSQFIHLFLHVSNL